VIPPDRWRVPVAYTSENRARPFRDSGGEPLAALGAATLDDCATRSGSAAGAESMLSFSASNIRLIGTFHEVSREVAGSAQRGYGWSEALSKHPQRSVPPNREVFITGRENPQCARAWAKRLIRPFLDDRESGGKQAIGIFCYPSFGCSPAILPILKTPPAPPYTRQTPEAERPLTSPRGPTDVLRKLELPSGSTFLHTLWIVLWNQREEGKRGRATVGILGRGDL